MVKQNHHLHLSSTMHTNEDDALHKKYVHTVSSWVFFGNWEVFRVVYHVCVAKTPKYSIRFIFWNEHPKPVPWPLHSGKMLPAWQTRGTSNFGAVQMLSSRLKGRQFHRFNQVFIGWRVATFPTELQVLISPSPGPFSFIVVSTKVFRSPAPTPFNILAKMVIWDHNNCLLNKCYILLRGNL